MIIKVSEWLKLSKEEKLRRILDAAVLNYRKIKSSHR